MLPTGVSVRSLSASTAVAAAAGAGVEKGGFLTYDTLNAHLKAAAYAVRGEIVLRAVAHQRALQAGEKRPFDSLIFSNIGNPQELGQAPITYARQVFACVNYPELLDNAAFVASMPPDVISRAKEYLAAIPGGTGKRYVQARLHAIGDMLVVNAPVPCLFHISHALYLHFQDFGITRSFHFKPAFISSASVAIAGAYSASQGLEHVRKQVAAFINKRDGIPANPADIFLTDGASPAVQMLIRCSIRDESDAFMIPIPQYPLYSASLALYGGSQVGYYLNEAGGWSLEVRPIFTFTHPFVAPITHAW